MAIVISLVATVVVVEIVTLITLPIARCFYRINDEYSQLKLFLFPRSFKEINLTVSGFHNTSIDSHKAMEIVSDKQNIFLKTRFSTYYEAIMPSGTSYFVKELNWRDKICQLGSRDKF